MDLRAWMRTDFPRACNVLYSFLVENMEDKDRRKFDNDLARRPPGQRTARRKTAPDGLDAMLAAAAAAHVKRLEESSTTTL